MNPRPIDAAQITQDSLPTVAATAPIENSTNGGTPRGGIEDVLHVSGIALQTQEGDARIAGRKQKTVVNFYRRFRADPLVVDKWLRVQATVFEADERVLDGVAALTRHPSYSATNPNKVGALLGGFFNGNAAAKNSAFFPSAARIWSPNCRATGCPSGTCMLSFAFADIGLEPSRNV